VDGQKGDEIMNESKPYCCPVCQGKATVPGGFYSSFQLGLEVCRSCKGTGIIWSSGYVQVLEQKPKSRKPQILAKRYLENMPHPQTFRVNFIDEYEKYLSWTIDKGTGCSIDYFDFEEALERWEAIKNVQPNSSL
jgi:hypothetical protein